MTTITVCTTCRGAKERADKSLAPIGDSFLQRVTERCDDALSVRGVACLMGCENGCNAAISAHGKLTYVLGRFDGTEDDADALVTYARLHLNSETGQVPFRSWPTGVKGHFIARIPPL